MNPVTLVTTILLHWIHAGIPLQGAGTCPQIIALMGILFAEPPSYVTPSRTPVTTVPAFGAMMSIRIIGFLKDEMNPKRVQGSYTTYRDS